MIVNGQQTSPRSTSSRQAPVRISPQGIISPQHISNTSQPPTSSVRSKEAFTAIRDSTAADSLKRGSHGSVSNDIQTTVTYTAKDSTLSDVINQLVELFGNAEVTYGKISLKAAYIRLNWITNEVFARGRYDSTTHKMIGQPIFQDGGDRYDTKEIRYNFKTKKGFIQGVITAQGEGNIRGKTVKKDAEDNLYVRNAIYTTCNLATPHFHINARKIKVVHNRQVISGPFNLVINEIPTPLALPFGFFPIPKKKEIGTSGLIFPQYGEEPNGRGFYLRDGGYYFAINQYVNLSVRGQVYSNGSWGLGIQSEYLKRYRYGGNLALSYARNRTTVVVDTTQAPRNDFSIVWSHSPRPRGNSTFSANVNVSSNSYNQLNSLNTQRYISNAANSGINYGYRFGSYVTTSASLNVSQNFGRVNPINSTREGGQTNISSSLTVGVMQIAPFALKGGTGRWYESFRVGMDFSSQAVLNNTRRTVDTSGLGFPVISSLTFRRDTTAARRDSLTRIANRDVYTNPNLIPFNLQNLPTILGNMQLSSRYSIPISLPNFKIARYINFTPGISLQGDLYTKRLRFVYSPLFDAVKVDTLSGISATYAVSFSASVNTRAYGTFFLRWKRLEAIRHTIAPSISFSYTPDLSSAFLERVQINKAGTIKSVSRYRGLGGYAGASNFTGSSASISYSIVNQIEMKVRPRNDSIKSEFEKVSLFDNISLSGSYNPYAPKYKFSQLSLSANTQILKKISFNFSSTFDPYSYEYQKTPTGLKFIPGQTELIQTGPYSNDSTLVRVNKLAITNGQGLAHLQNLTLYLSTQFAPKQAKKPKKTPNATTPAEQTELRAINAFPEDYVDFNIPWSINLSYSFNLNKYSPLESQVIQSLQLTGDLSLTPKWKVSISSGYDFAAKSPSLTTLSLHRDLHCWDMNFNWTPFSGSLYRSNFYSFDLKVKSSILQDLKLSRRRGNAYSY